MKRLALILAVLVAAPAVAQNVNSNVSYPSYPWLPPNTVLSGPLGGSAQPGPPSAVPVAALLANAGGITCPQLPTLTGDTTTTAGSCATTTGKVQGIPYKTGTPTNGQVYAYVSGNGDMEPTTLAGTGTVTEQKNTAGSGLTTSGNCDNTSTNASSPCQYAVSAGQVPGTTTNDNASSGNVGEYMTAARASGSATSLSNNSPSNVTSISLTAGDWDVWGVVSFTGATNTTVNYEWAIISTTSASNTPVDALGGIQEAENAATVFNYTIPNSLLVGPSRVSIGSTTSVYLNAESGFGTSTQSAYGTIRARRVR